MFCVVCVYDYVCALTNHQVYREGTTGADGPTRVLHATHSPGFDLRRQVSADNQTRLNCDAEIVMMEGHVVWRPLNLTAERLQEVHTRMDELIDELCGVPFPEQAKFATNYMR